MARVVLRARARGLEAERRPLEQDFRTAVIGDLLRPDFATVHVNVHGPVSASPPPSIIPALPAAPGPVNITAPIAASGSYTVAAGQYVRGAELPYLFEGGSGGSIAPFVNNGTLWNSATSNPSTRVSLSRSGQVGDITNNGTMVLYSGPNVSVYTVGFDGATLHNNGSIYVITEGTKNAVMLEGAGVVSNNGLVAVKSSHAAATAYLFNGGGHVINGANGSILTEGVRANSVLIYSDGTADSTGKYSGLTNDGRIEAVATGAGEYSTALVGVHLYNNPIELLNRGTIKADVAFVSTFGTTTARPGLDVVTNEASGTIQGFFFLDRGDDVLTNRGTIRGDIYMEEGADKVENSGTIEGIVDLGWGADSFKGSAGTDLVAGDDGDDQIEGNGGDDLLMGGGNDDRLTGGVGNDGLFGEYGNDVLVTQAGDYVSGGEGDDRIEAGDFGFETIDGGAGFDTLVLPGIGRAIDLSAVLAQQGLAEIEKIDMGGGQSLFVRAADVTALTGGETSLRIATNASDAVNLIGGWAAGANQVIGGVAYRSYSLSGATILVAGNGTVTPNAATGGSGLDSLSGALAPVPDDGHGLGFTDNVRLVDRYELHQSITVNPEAVWMSEDGHAVLTSFALLTLTNYGQLISRREAASTTFSNVFGVGEGYNNFERLINYGTISADNLSTAAMGGYGFTTVNGDAALDNYGTISASSVAVRAQAVVVTRLLNAGHLVATGTNAFTVGVELNGGTFSNSGEIRATGNGGDNNYGLSSVVGAWFKYASDYSNAGTIAAVNAGGGGATAAWFEITNGAAIFSNSGTLTGQTAIHVRSDPYYGGRGTLYLTNHGGAMLNGRVEMAGGDDRITNNGTITGAVLLGDGDDFFDGTIGVQQATVDGGAGKDTLTGGAGADILIGGEGADIMDGKGGADTFRYLAASDSTASAMDRIRNFQTGVDKIDLEGLPGGTVSWVQQSDAEGQYSLVTVTAPAGTLQIRVDGPVALSDFVLPINRVQGGPSADTLTGTSGKDELRGEGGADLLQGLGGADLLDGGTGADRLEGGAGDDLYYVDDGADQVIELAGEGNDRVVTTVNYRIAGGSEVEILEAAAGSAAFRIDGNAMTNILLGNSTGNFLDGGAGADMMSARGGNDTYIVDHASDVVNELAGEGFDAAYAFVSFALTANSELEWLSTIDNSATNAIDLTGSAIGQYLIGNMGANVLNGLAGADFMQGFGGNDTYYVDNGADAPVEALNGGFDAVYTDISFGLANGTEIEWMSLTASAGTSPLNLLGNEFGQYLVGNAGNNALDGAGGADILIGYGGNDTYIVDQGGDTVIEAAGAGFDAVYTTASFALGAGSEVEWLSAATVGATIAMDLGGNEFGQYILGNAGANVIDGGGGLDILYGYGGADIFQFATAPGAGNVDTIADFVSGTDKIALDDAIFTALGAFGAGAFVTGSAAADADDRIVYNAATGQLYYDADGNGAGAAVLFATLQGNPALVASDFQVI